MRKCVLHLVVLLIVIVIAVISEPNNIEGGIPQETNTQRDLVHVNQNITNLDEKNPEKENLITEHAHLLVHK